MAWVSQGPITDRTQEHLGRSDAGVAMLRKMFKENMKKVADGEDPIGTVREKHDIIKLPCEKDKFGAEREFAAAWITGGSMRYSPIKQQLLDLHEGAWANKAKAGGGCLTSTSCRPTRTGCRPAGRGSRGTPSGTCSTGRGSAPCAATALDADGGISTEYWAGDARYFMTWCGGCGWFGEVVRFDMVTITEVEH